MSVAVIQYPGSNCEFETLRAVQLAGLQGEIVRWNVDPKSLDSFQAYILVGGFSYQDRIRAGAVAARKPLMEALIRYADDGRPILGICNGAQVLVESGIVPGNAQHEVQMALATNYAGGRTGYFCTWSTVKVTSKTDQSPFLNVFSPDETFPVPIAHGEGRFVTLNEGLVGELKEWGQIALTYSTPDGEVTNEFPHNPNGSMEGIAGLTNKQGNVLAMMPHPERCAQLFQLPQSYPHPWMERRGTGANWSTQRDAGPGLKFFQSLKTYLQ